MTPKRLVSRSACLLTAAWVAGCGTIADQYRASNGSRRVYPATATLPKGENVDLITLLDPLGLGYHRLVNASLVKVEELDERQRYEAAFLGFSDPSYPQRLCSKSGAFSSTTEIDAELARRACSGQRPSSVNPKPTPTHIVTTVTTVVTTESAAFRGPQRDGLVLPTETDRWVEVSVKEIPKAPPYLVEFQTNRRNLIQDRLIEASNAKCEAFKGDLYLARSDTSFGLGLTTLGLGAAGAIVGELARTFAVLQTATVGAGAAFDKSYFNEQSITEIVTNGIDAKRKEILQGIQTTRREKNIAGYSINAAVGEAIAYNDACTVLHGLKEAKDTLSARLEGLQKLLDDRVDAFDKAATEEKAAAAAQQAATQAAGPSAGGGASSPASGNLSTVPSR